MKEFIINLKRDTEVKCRTIQKSEILRTHTELEFLSVIMLKTDSVLILLNTQEKALLVSQNNKENLHWIQLFLQSMQASRFLLSKKF